VVSVEEGMKNSFHDHLRQFYESNKQGLFTYALSLTRNISVAEDAVHTAFFGIVKRQFLPRDLRPYIFRAIRNAAVDLKRKDASTDGIFVEENLDSSDPYSSRMLNQCLEQLPEEEREIVIMKAIVGLTFSEISHLHRKSINTVTSRYRRAIEKMRSLIGGNHD
jgi:RNA polymerase sigma-70 factor, ECF subfamily